MASKLQGSIGMRRLRIFEHMSLDGVIQLPGGSVEDFVYGDWTLPYRSPAGLAAMVEMHGERYDLLLGRRTYDIWTGYWPTAPKSPMADRLNAATKYIVTHNPETLTWGPVEGVGPDFAEGVRAIKAKGDADLILWGSSTLASALLEQGLVDEVNLVVYPVLLGTGKRFFTEGTPARTLTLESTKAMPSGNVVNTFKVVGAVQKQK
jgi:dihydrofolate reductase